MWKEKPLKQTMGSTISCWKTVKTHQELWLLSKPIQSTDNQYRRLTVSCDIYETWNGDGKKISSIPFMLALSCVVCCQTETQRMLSSNLRMARESCKSEPFQCTQQKNLLIFIQTIHITRDDFIWYFHIFFRF